MTMKNDAKFEEELICHSKINMRNLKNFVSNTGKSKKFALQLVPFTKVKKHRGVMFDGTED